MTQPEFSRRTLLAGPPVAGLLSQFNRLVATAAEPPVDEITPASGRALARGLAWLAKNQGAAGNWGSNDLGLVATGMLAFLAAGCAPGRGKYGKETQKALSYLLEKAKPSGLLNVANPRRDMYNHGLATFVLGQAHGMTTGRDRRLNQVLDRALKLIINTQCDDGGWDYNARRKPAGHDLSLVVMQAKALRSAVDSGLEVPPEVVELAIQAVRRHYWPLVPAGKGNAGSPRPTLTESQLRQRPGRFTYGQDGDGATTAMAAAGVVCLQEFGQYDDWRIAKNMQVIQADIMALPKATRRDGHLPFDAYTLYYVAQALYQVGGTYWRTIFPQLRDYAVTTQIVDAGNATRHGSWVDLGARGAGRVGGVPGQLYGTAVACFLLAIPNRFLPILQEGKIEALRSRYPAK